MSTHAVYNHWYDEDDEVLKVEMKHPGTFGAHVIRVYENFPVEKYNKWAANGCDVCSYFFSFIDEHSDEYPAP